MDTTWARSWLPSGEYTVEAYYPVVTTVCTLGTCDFGVVNTLGSCDSPVVNTLEVPTSPGVLGTGMFFSKPILTVSPVVIIPGNRGTVRSLWRVQISSQTFDKIINPFWASLYGPEEVVFWKNQIKQTSRHFLVKSRPSFYYCITPAEVVPYSVFLPQMFPDLYIWFYAGWGRSGDDILLLLA
jgi:hypothetical protein